MYSCKILADSISPADIRLTTFQITYPYIIHPEVMTHRMFSRNSQSSRATPVMKNVDKVRDDPFIPEVFRRNIRGMTDGDPLREDETQNAESIWRRAVTQSISHAEALSQLEVHKGLANRVLGPYQWWTSLVTATDYDHFFALRNHREAQREIREIADRMQHTYEISSPAQLKEGDWHLPLIRVEDEVDNLEILIKVAIGRCARVSYLTHDGRRDPQADIELYERLLSNFHMSPFEHVARPFTEYEWEIIGGIQSSLGLFQKFGAQLKRQLEYVGNLRGWWSARMDIPNQHNFALVNRANFD